MMQTRKNTIPRTLTMHVMTEAGSVFRLGTGMAAAERVAAIPMTERYSVWDLAIMWGTI